jgi:hypothetical protein
MHRGAPTSVVTGQARNALVKAAKGCGPQHRRWIDVAAGDVVLVRVQFGLGLGPLGFRLVASGNATRVDRQE